MKDLKVLHDGNTRIAHVIPEDSITDTLLKYGCPKDELWLIEDSTIQMAANFYGWDTIFDLTNNKDYKRCIYYHESGAIGAFAGYNNREEFEIGCKFIADYLK